MPVRRPCGLSIKGAHAISVLHANTMQKAIPDMTDPASAKTAPLDPEHPISVRKRRLKYRSWKRGTKEMDLLMGSFADAHIDTMSEDELDQFEALLRESDPDLYSWYMKNSEPPADHANPMLPRFLAFSYQPDSR